MAKIRGTRSRQATGDGWPEAVIRWVRAIGNPKLLRAQSKLFSWARLDLGQPTPVALARNGPGDLTLAQEKGPTGTGGGQGGSWPTCILEMDARPNSITGADSEPHDAVPFPFRGCSREEANSGRKVQRIDGTRQNHISPGSQRASESRLAPGRAGCRPSPAQERGQGADRPIQSVRSDWSRTVRGIYAVPIRAWRDGSSIFAFAFRIPPPWGLFSPISSAFV